MLISVAASGAGLSAIPLIMVLVVGRNFAPPLTWAIAILFPFVFYAGALLKYIQLCPISVDETNLEKCALGILQNKVKWSDVTRVGEQVIVRRSSGKKIRITFAISNRGAITVSDESEGYEATRDEIFKIANERGIPREHLE